MGNCGLDVEHSMDNVKDHMHYFASSQEDIHGRFDACAMEDGSFVVYSAEVNSIVCKCISWETACETAQLLAESYEH